MGNTVERVYKYPVWVTQDGTLARSIGDGRYIFITKPNRLGLDLDVGDDVPGGWRLNPFNDLAHREIVDYDEPMPG